MTIKVAQVLATVGNKPGNVTAIMMLSPRLLLHLFGILFGDIN